MKLKLLALALSLATLVVPPAFAVRTAITVKTPQKIDGTVSAGAADATFTAADTTNKNSFVSTGREIVIAFNSGGADYTATITSAPDDLGRTKDVDAYALQAGDYAVFGPVKQKGWKQSDGKIYLEGSNAAVKFLVIRLPQGF